MSAVGRTLVRLPLKKRGGDASPESPACVTLVGTDASPLIAASECYAPHLRRLLNCGGEFR
jgi:hypothetical protein